MVFRTVYRGCLALFAALAAILAAVATIAIAITGLIGAIAWLFLRGRRSPRP